ncbi:Ger(x)C family spore germination protein [Virgibacillus ndiopensis]|uniref:Ger(x)C family spore germination protein n=1 Tax=Virgibacillus ndiopensis TaxID=2004408 RepID=UPI000C082819|nr:Ger(x)C family spore germination protein [Virgibacillus ndiopensis]
MKRTTNLCIAFLFLSVTTGCWNLEEPDQLSFVTGAGLDLTEDGKLEASYLVVLPASLGSGQISGGENKNSFQVMSATGKNVSDAMVNVQSKLSRKVFSGHRDIFLVGQRLAEHGMGKTIDPFLRIPKSEMRSMIYVVKNGKPKDVFSIVPFFDRFITTSLSDEQKAIGLKPYLAREFVVDVLSEGKQPLVPVVGLNPSGHYSYRGSGIFNKADNVKLVGFLNMKETAYARWITNDLTRVTLTSSIPKEDGSISLTLHSLDQNIHVQKIDEQLQITVQLSGKGTIIENTTNLDPTKQKDLQLIQDELNQKNQKLVHKIIKKVQEEYKMDIFGFGEQVHQQSPQQWKSLKQNWTETFSQLNVSVKVDLQCTNLGQTDSSIYP